MSKKFLFTVLAAALTFGVLTGCGKKSESSGKSESNAEAKPKQIKARSIAEDEKLGIKFSEDKKTLVEYNAELKDAEYAIPSGVTTIGKGAFAYCTSLTSVTIPSGVTTIGDSTFLGCESLTSVTIPSSVTTIGFAAFEGCTSLTSVTIPEGVTTIGNMAFARCKNLTSVTIPEGVTDIGGGAFVECPCEDSVKKQFPKYE